VYEKEKQARKQKRTKRNKEKQLKALVNKELEQNLLLPTFTPYFLIPF